MERAAKVQDASEAVHSRVLNHGVGRWRSSGAGALRGVFVRRGDSAAEAAPDPEAHRAAGRDLHRLLGLRVQAGAGSAVLYVERPEADKLDFAVYLETASDRAEHGVHGAFGVCFGALDAEVFLDFGDQVSLVHGFRCAAGLDGIGGTARRKQTERDVASFDRSRGEVGAKRDPALKLPLAAVDERDGPCIRLGPGLHRRGYP